MTDPDIDVAAWRERIAALRSQDVTAAVVVQCEQIWLQRRFMVFRNELDKALMTAQMLRGSRLTINRIVLHNLPLTSGGRPRPSSVDRAFDEWHHRLSAASLLLCANGQPAPRIHRLILRGDQSAAPVPDMVELLVDGDWTDPHRARLALDTINTAGATTLLTGYDIDLDGPFGDTDPSVYL